MQIDCWFSHAAAQNFSVFCSGCYARTERPYVTIAAVDWDIKPRIKQKWFDSKFSLFSIFSSDCYAGINMTRCNEQDVPDPDLLT